MTLAARRPDDIRDARRNIRKELLVTPKEMAPISFLARFLGAFSEPKELGRLQDVLDSLDSAHYDLVPVFSGALVDQYGRKWKKLKALCDELAKKKLELVKPEDYDRLYPEPSTEAEEDDE